MKTRHQWTKAEKDILYNNKHMSVREIKRMFFAHDHTVTNQAIADKLYRVVAEREMPNHEKPWSPQDITRLHQIVRDDKNAGIRTTNDELSIMFGRGPKELNQAYFDMLHYGRIRTKRKKKHTSDSDSFQSAKSSAPFTTTTENLGSKRTVTFREKNGNIHFTLNLRVHKTKSGLVDLVSELRKAASSIEHNNEFVL